MRKAGEHSPEHHDQIGVIVLDADSDRLPARETLTPEPFGPGGGFDPKPGVAYPAVRSEDRSFIGCLGGPSMELVEEHFPAP